jgi:hypothetical protein
MVPFPLVMLSMQAAAHSIQRIVNDTMSQELTPARAAKSDVKNIEIRKARFTAFVSVTQRSYIRLKSCSCCSWSASLW